MKVLKAGDHKVLYLELDTKVVGEILSQLGLEHNIKDSPRALQIDFSVPGRQAPLLLFDASDPGNLGWFSRCQFYVDGQTAAVLQTPISIANVRDHGGRPLPTSLRLQVTKELPIGFRLPGRQPATEQVIYGLLYNFLNALLQSGVAVCGSGVVKALAGRTDTLGPRS